MNPDGIPNRPWYKHVIFAKRFTYEHLELPGVTEAVEAKDWKLAQEQTLILQRAVEKNTTLLQTLNTELKR
jgi:N-acetylated-alpha-linked acidic dipeptidase